MKVHVTYTRGLQPIGNGIGPVLEARDVLRVLKQTDDRPMDLEKKSLFIASEILKMTGVKKSMEKATEILRSGEAYSKMKEIIEAQGGDPNVKITDLKVAPHSKTLSADTSGKIAHISNHAIARLGLTCGAPIDKNTGIILHHHVGDKVDHGDKLLTIYTKTKSKLNYVYSLAKQLKPIKIV
jgi:AMP phosphorylase